MQCAHAPGLDAHNDPFVVTEFVGGGELGEPVHAGTRLPPETAVWAEVEATIRDTGLEPQMKSFALWEDWVAGRRGRHACV